MIRFETWYQREYPRIVNALTLTTGNQQVAADAASEAFVRALAKWDRVSVMERPGGWLYKVALNDARRRLRKARRDRCLLYTSPSPRDRTRSRMPSSA